MYVTNLQWCDFVVWSPMEEPFVLRINYNSTFMSDNLLKAHAFYFKKLLPSVAPHLIVSPTEYSLDLTKSMQYSLMGCRERNGTSKEPDCLKLVHGYLDPRTNADEQKVNLEKQDYKSSSGEEPQHSPTEKLDPTANQQEVMV